jgi:hypothetical protein
MISATALLCLVMGYLLLILTTHHADNFAGPFMAVAGVLVALLSVGLTERFIQPCARSEK